MAVEMMKEYAFDENEDFEIVLEDFQRGISELFNLDDIDEMDEETQYAVNQAIDNLFKLFDTEDKGMINEDQLRKGFRKFLPDPNENHKKIINNPRDINTVEQIFKEIDTDETGILNEEKFMEYLKPYIKDTDQLKTFSSQCALDADENRSGNVSKLEFIKWRDTKGYLHLINVLEGKGVPFSLEESPRSLEGRQSQRSSRPEMYRSKTMLSTEK